MLSGVFRPYCVLAEKTGSANCEEDVNRNEQIACVRCRVPMENGFVADTTYGGYLQQKWYPGEPQSGFWAGVKVKKEQSIPVTTLRCPNCGYLESYAARRTVSD
jgi:hypothetical protein